MILTVKDKLLKLTKIVLTLLLITFRQNFIMTKLTWWIIQIWHWPMNDSSPMVKKQGFSCGDSCLKFIIHFFYKFWISFVFLDHLKIVVYCLVVDVIVSESFCVVAPNCFYDPHSEESGWGKEFRFFALVRPFIT